jgi:hypothetical protein
VADFKANDLVKAYISIRNERGKLAKEYEAKDLVLKEKLQRLEQAMLSACNDIDADSIKTNSGVIIRSLRENYVCGDWDNFKKFILENNALELLQQRISQTNFKEFINSRKDEGLPPGISTMREFNITVRKSSNQS